MMLRSLHFAVGFAGVAAFLGTGVYLNSNIPDLYGANEALRYIYRANHVYVLFASLVNLALGAQLAPLPSDWRAVATGGSVLALASPIVLCLAFAFEAPRAEPERILTLLGVVMAALGVVAHVLCASTARGSR